jgi:hypothetical protein
MTTMLDSSVALALSLLAGLPPDAPPDTITEWNVHASDLLDEHQRAAMDAAAALGTKVGELAAAKYLQPRQ